MNLDLASSPFGDWTFQDGKWELVVNGEIDYDIVDFANPPESVWDFGVDAELAAQEGWNIFQCDGSDAGEWQMCVIEEPELMPELEYTEKKFETDDDVWIYVINHAISGSDMHIRALKFLLENNEPEFSAIMGHWVNEKLQISQRLLTIKE